MVRVFDPRPPWWRKSIYFLLATVSTILLIVVQSTAGADSFYSATIIKFAGDYRDDSTLIAYWPLHFSRLDYVDRVELGSPFISLGGPASISDLHNNPVALLESEDLRADELREQLAALTIDWGSNDSPDLFHWHRDAFQIVNKQPAGAVVTRKLYLQRVTVLIAWSVVVMLSVFGLGSVIVYRRIRSDIRCLDSTVCPKCLYSLAGNNSFICSECGLQLDRKRRLLVALSSQGYRGLKRFMAMEREGAK